MSEGPSPRELSAMLADEIEMVVMDLGIDVRRRDRRKLYCAPPWGDSAKPKLEIELYPMAGKWNDWLAGRFGDALGLVGCVLTGQPDMKTRDARREGIKWARARYGLAGGDFDREAWQRNVAAAKARAEDARRAAAQKLKENRGVAQHIWMQAELLRPTTWNGTVAIKGCNGARYLEARGVDFAVLGRPVRAVRYSPGETWFGKDGEQHLGPALVSAMTLKEGGFGSIHRIWINPDREGEKADLDPPRKMWPQSEGAAIRLWRGRNWLQERDAIAKGQQIPLVVCEGVEDGLSAAMMVPEYRITAAGSLPGLLSFDPPACASEVIVLADNDWGKPQAAAVLKRALERLATLGKPVRVARSPEGKDFNDLLRGDA